MAGSLGRTAPYCLYCHTPLPSPMAASERCEACGEINLRVDLDTYWTLSPGARRTEARVKIIGAFGIAALTALALLADVNPAGTGWKVVVLVGAFVPALVWLDLASLCTRWRSRTRVELFVPALFIVLAAGPLLWAVVHAFTGSSANLLLGLVQSLGALLVVQPFAFASLLLVKLVERRRRAAQSVPIRRAIEEGRRSGRDRTRPAPAESVAAVRGARGLADTRPSSSYGGVGPGSSGYCLHCFAPFREFTGATERCDLCGEVTLRVDQDLYWTRNRRYRRIEKGVKTVAAVAAAAGIVALVSSDSKVVEDVHWLGPFGMTVAPLAALLAWDLSGLITRKRALAAMSRTLPIVVGSFGFMMVFLGRVLLNIKWKITSGPLYERLFLPWSFGVPFLLLGLVVAILARLLVAWRDRALMRGLEAGRERALARSAG